MTENHPVFRMNDGTEDEQYRRYYESISYGIGIKLDTDSFQVDSIQQKIQSYQDAFLTIERTFEPHISVTSTLIFSLEFLQFSIQMIQIILYILQIHE